MNKDITAYLIREKFINGSYLKLIAIISMLIDHIGYFILAHIESAHHVLFTVWNLNFSLYFITRFIGRSAFPLFAFLLVEGFIHTRNQFKYGLNLFIFAVISEIPWNLVHSNHFLYEKQNVFFTLFLGLLALQAINRWKDTPIKMFFSLLLILSLSYFLRIDYGIYGVLFIISLHILASNPILMPTVGICILPDKWISGLAFIPIAFYNGKRGFIQGNWTKYAFYLFYPVHLFILYGIKLYLFT